MFPCIISDMGIYLPNNNMIMLISPEYVLKKSLESDFQE